MKFTWKFPFVVFLTVPDCLVCAFNLNLAASILFRTECPHMEPHVVKARIFLSRKRFWCLLVLSSPAIISWVRLFFQPKRSDEFIPSMFSFLNETWTILLLFSLIKYRKQYVTHFNGLSELLEKRKRFGLATLLSERQTKKIQYGIAYVIFACAILITTQFLLYFTTNSIEISKIVKLVSASTNITSGALFACHIAQWLNLYKDIFEKLLSSIQNELENKRRRVKTDLAYKLYAHQSFYIACVLNYRNQVLTTTDVSFDAWQFLYLILSQIFVFLYVAFIIIRKTIQIKLEVTTGLMQSLFLESLSYIVFERLNCVYNINDEFLNYIYKYPISELNEEERHLVETFIFHLNTYKPVVNQGGVFELGKRIIPSIVSHVITYCLMALQFNILEYFN